MEPSSDSDDRRLVAEFLASRSDDAFLSLYDRHSPGLFRFAARLAGGPGTVAEDLVQEAWVRAVDRLPGFRWASSLRTWLCGFVLNRWREVRRRELRDRTLMAAVEHGPVGDERDPDLSRRLEGAIAALPQGYREVLVLHDVEGRTHEEIARHFGIAEGTSKSQLHRARRALRDALDPRGEGDHGASPE